MPFGRGIEADRCVRIAGVQVEHVRFPVVVVVVELDSRDCDLHHALSGNAVPPSRYGLGTVSQSSVLASDIRVPVIVAVNGTPSPRGVACWVPVNELPSAARVSVHDP
ncbi:MAG: hypothetical protein M5T61_17640 [Acidimicrobiia bacterium]|nr:hypothetical protein [Acidimicrobiia bacterium]